MKTRDLHMGNFAEALNAAGYMQQPGEYRDVIEFGDHFVFAARDNVEGSFMVGRFNKAKFVSGVGADFVGAGPDIEDLTEAQALAVMSLIRKTNNIAA